MVVISVNEDSVPLDAEMIKKFLSQSLRVQDSWYMLSQNWYSQLVSVLNEDNSSASRYSKDVSHKPIDNSVLLDERNNLKSNLIEDKDFIFVPEKLWLLLLDKFGLEGNAASHVIKRRCINLLNPAKCAFSNPNKLVIEVYLTKINFLKYPDHKSFKSKEYSKSTLLFQIRKDIFKIFNLSEDSCYCIWWSETSEPIAKYKPIDVTAEDSLFEAGISPSSYFIVEEMTGDGAWPLRKIHPLSSAFSFNSISRDACSPSSSSNGNDSSAQFNGAYEKISSRSNSPALFTIKPHSGLSGLVNLGNTCFMNSALQCLSNVFSLSMYFLNKTYIKDINKTNPLGMRGKLAEEYANLIHSLWSNQRSNSVIAPRAFKSRVGEFAPMFYGYQQHDSQELLTFLLDGLHEDLNRVKNRPYVEQRDLSGVPDSEASEESWNNFKLRNDSIIVDSFYGQLKSTLVCPVCHLSSKCFDPFCFVSLPLVSKCGLTVKLKFYPLDEKKQPGVYRVTIPNHSTVGDLCAYVSENVAEGTDEGNLIVCKIISTKDSETIRPCYDRSLELSSVNLSCDAYFAVYEISPTLPYHQSVDVKVFTFFHRLDAVDLFAVSHMSNSYLLSPFFISVRIPSGSDLAQEKQVVRDAVVKKLKSVFKAHQHFYAENIVDDDPDTDHDDHEDDSDFKDVLNFNEEKSKEPEATDLPNEEDITHKDKKTSQIKWSQICEAFTLNFSDPQAPRFLGFKRQSCQTQQIVPINVAFIDWSLSGIKPLFSSLIQLCTFRSSSERNSSYTSKSEGMLSRQRTSCSLQDCIDLFLSVEKLAHQDTWYCPRCKDFQQASKKFDFWRLPNILIIHLKRFCYSRFARNKLTISVNFPLSNLDLSAYVSANVQANEDSNYALYDLLAVSNHYGDMGYGHYTAFAHHKPSKTWYSFDDSSVSPLKENNMNISNFLRSSSSSAYVLFYQRRTPHPHSSTTSTSPINNTSCPSSSSPASSSSSEMNCSLKMDLDNQY